jgi:hypothetical protein
MSYFRRYLANGNPFTGADLDPRLWLDSSYAPSLFDATSGGALVTADNAAVRRWEDRSGNGFHFTDATGFVLKTGIYNTRNTLRLSGSVMMTNAALTVGMQNMALIMVTKDTTAKDNAGLFTCGGTGAGNDYDNINRFQIDTGYSGLDLIANFANFATDIRTYGPRPSGLQVRILNMREGQLSVYRHGDRITASKAAVFDDRYPGLGTTFAGAGIGGRYIGGVWAAAATNRFAGDVCEYLLIPRSLSNTEIVRATVHLLAKWDPVYANLTELTTSWSQVTDLTYQQTIFGIDLTEQTLVPDQTLSADYAQTIESLSATDDAIAPGNQLSLTYAP